jgi:hypothetical protein
MDLEDMVPERESMVLVVLERESMVLEVLERESMVLVGMDLEEKARTVPGTVGMDPEGTVDMDWVHMDWVHMDLVHIQGPLRMACTILHSSSTWAFV